MGFLLGQLGRETGSADDIHLVHNIDSVAKERVKSLYDTSLTNDVSHGNIPLYDITPNDIVMEGAMNANLVTQFKWFWAWQDDKQEDWLEAMSQEGLHLQSIKAFGRYVFEPGAPRKYTYRMDFDQTSGKDSDYFHLIREAGWKRITEVAGWQYWRKEAREGKTPELYTDTESKIRKYQRLLVSLLLPSPAFIVVLGVFKRFPGRHPQWFVALVISTFAALFLFLTVNLVNIALRIIELKRMQTL